MKNCTVGKLIILVAQLVVFIAMSLHANEENTTAIGKPNVREYFKESNDENFDSIKISMPKDSVRLLCKGNKYLEFETSRGTFAFGIDNYPSPLVRLPGNPDLRQEIDFFVNDKRILVAYYYKGRVDGLMVFDMTIQEWENRTFNKKYNGHDRETFIPPDFE